MQKCYHENIIRYHKIAVLVCRGNRKMHVWYKRQNNKESKVATPSNNLGVRLCNNGCKRSADGQVLQAEQVGKCSNSLVVKK